MKPLVVIPARGGSKGLPGKNIKPLNGKPLILYTVEAAREVFPDELICVSTDDEEIKKVVEASGLEVPFLRPAHLATDQSGTHEVLLHAINFHEQNGYYPDTLILLQPTSPLRNASHIKEALAVYDESCDMVISVNETKANPYYTLREETKDGWLVKSKEGNFTRRQDCPKVYEVNGAIYIANINITKEMTFSYFKNVKKYVMKKEYSIDIDTNSDYILASILIKHFYI